MKITNALLFASTFALFSACTGTTDPDTGGGSEDGGAREDAGSSDDAGAPGDGGGPRDGGSPRDAGTDGGGPLTWTNGAAQFFEVYCGACHWEGDSAGRDYSTLAGVQAESSTIRCGVTAEPLADCSGFPPPKQFPIAAPYPSDAERASIVAWIEAGLPE